jgi:hypothetical protein
MKTREASSMIELGAFLVFLVTALIIVALVVDAY